MQIETRVKRTAVCILVFGRCQQARYVMLGDTYLSLCIGFTLPVEFLDVLRKAREIRNDKLMPERSRNEDDICRYHAAKRCLSHHFTFTCFLYSMINSYTVRLFYRGIVILSDYSIVAS
jgi:hypothetical protein